MPKFHVSKDGVARKCPAEIQCTLTEADGSATPHGEFATAQEAQALAEEVNAKRFNGSFGAVKNSSRTVFGTDAEIKSALKPFRENGAIMSTHGIRTEVAKALNVPVADVRYPGGVIKAYKDGQVLTLDEDGNYMGVEPYSKEPDDSHFGDGFHDSKIANTIEEEDLAMARSLYSNDGMTPEEMEEWRQEAYKLGVKPQELTPENTKRDAEFLKALSERRVKTSDGVVWTSEDILRSQSMFSNDGMDWEDENEWRKDAHELGVHVHEGQGFLDHTFSGPRYLDPEERSMSSRIKELFRDSGAGKLASIFTRKNSRSGTRV